MKTITVKLPDHLNASLDAEAAARGVPKSEVVRAALQQVLPRAREAAARKVAKPSIHDRLRKYQGAGGAGVGDLASNPKHLEGYGRK